MPRRIAVVSIVAASAVAFGAFHAVAQNRGSAPAHANPRANPHATSAAPASSAAPTSSSSPAPTTSSAPPASTAAPTGPMLLDPNPATASLRVTIPGLVNGVIPQENAFGGMGCTGQNRSPRITWSGAPAGTRSFAIIVHDPDAPTGVGFFHWIVANLPANTTELAAGATIPTGAIQTQTDFGQAGYGGPCPPPGETHRYVFSVYALDVPRLELPATASGALTRFMLRGHTLALGRAIGTYRRP